MNIQTERLENHTARLTAEIEPERFEKAKQDAARNIAQKVNIPGFRKGKAPYRILVNYVGEAAIIEEAVEKIGNAIYKEVLEEAQIEPYGQGQLENFELEPTPKLQFVVALQPVIDLADYRSVRMEFEEPTVSDDDVNDAIKTLVEREALIEESHKPVALGNRVTVDIFGEIVTAEAPASETEATEAAETAVAAEADAGDDEKSEVVIDRKAAIFILDEEHEPVTGFSAALEGAQIEETREFEIGYPDDPEEYEDLSGKRVRFVVTIKKIETRILPILNDEFAARITKDEAEPLTLLQLRIRVRENMQRSEVESAKSEFTFKVLDKIVEQAQIAYPEAMLDEEIHHLITHDMQRMGLREEDFLRLTKQSHEDLHKVYHDRAEVSLKRSLALRELLLTEKLLVTDESIDQEIERVLLPEIPEDQREQFRTFFSDSVMRDKVRNDLLQQQVLDRVAAIAKGEAPELPTAVEEAAAAVEPAASEPVEELVEATETTEGETE